MSPRFFKGHFHRPATHKPGQHLRAGILQIGRQQGLWFKARLRVTNQDPADGHRRFARVIPDRRVRGDLDLTWAFLPILHRQRAPPHLRLPAPSPGSAGVSAEAGATALSWCTRRRGIARAASSRRRVITPDTGQPCHQGEPFQGPAKLLSATKTSSRSGNQRRTSRMLCQARFSTV